MVVNIKNCFLKYCGKKKAKKYDGDNEHIAHYELRIVY